MPDILIRGIGLPRQGLKVVAIHSNGHVYADTSDPGILNKIADVIELPPHGDLIGRDALKRKFCAHCDGYEYDTNACVNGDQDCMDVKIIMNAPVIVPADKEETE